MKIVFLILMHKNPEQAIRLIKALDGANSVFVVHVDGRAPRDVLDHMTKHAATRSNINLTERYNCRWGGFGLVRATFACVHAGLRLPQGFDYGVLLSGQDYPIKPLSFMMAFLNDRRGKQFIESFRLDLKNRWSADIGVWNPLNKVTWYTIPIRGRRIHIPFRRRFPSGLHPFGGSQWWCLSRDCLDYIARFAQEKPRVLRYFRHVFIPDESLFHTIILNSSFAPQVVSDDLHYTDWARPNPAVPRTLDLSDFERLRASNKLFARKFDIAHDNKVLDLIDSEILNQ